MNLVDQTTKVGWSRGSLFVERQAPLEGTDNSTHMDPAELDRIVQAATAGVDVSIDWNTARLAFQQASGVPVRVGERNFSRVPATAPADAAALAQDPPAESAADAVP